MALTERQSRIAATAITTVSAVVIIGASVAVLWLLGVFFATFSGVFLPLAVAAILALVLKPWYRWLCTHARLSPVVAVLAVFVSILLPLLAFFVFFGAVVVSQVSDALEQLPNWWVNARQAVEARWPEAHAAWQEHGVSQKLLEFAQEHSARLTEWMGTVGIQAYRAGSGVAAMISGLLGWVVLPVYLAFFLMGRAPSDDTLNRNLPFLSSSARRDAIYLGREFVGILVTFFRGQLVIALAQGALFGIGFMLIGLKYGFVLGFFFGFLNIIPYLGSMLTLATALPLALLQEGGGWLKFVLVLGVFAVVQVVEGYVLTPRIMGKSTGLHPVAIIAAIFFWGTALNGIAGMILAIPLTAFAVVLWRLVREKGTASGSD